MDKILRYTPIFASLDKKHVIWRQFVQACKDKKKAIYITHDFQLWSPELQKAKIEEAKHEAVQQYILEQAVGG